MIKILFVCRQNVFRSKCAEYLAKKYIEDNNLKNIQISSAGTDTKPDIPYQLVIDRLVYHGVNSKKLNYSQTLLTKKIIDENDYIVCMTELQKQRAIELSHDTSKIFLFNELAFNVLNDLEDEVEADMTNYDLNDFIVKTVDTINKGIPSLIKKIPK